MAALGPPHAPTRCRLSADVYYLNISEMSLDWALREFSEIMWSAARKTFQRRQCFAERRDQGLRPVEFVVFQSYTRLGMVQR